MPVNECTPFKSPGSAVTGKCTAAVTGKRFVKISGNRTGGGGGGLSTDLANVYQISNATASGEIVFGVARQDGANGSLIGVHCQPGIIIPITCGADCASGIEVQTDAVGKCIPLAAGKAVGYVMNGALSGADAEVRLY